MESTGGADFGFIASTPEMNFPAAGRGVPLKVKFILSQQAAEN
jgi:hypothetical protein